MWVNVVFNRPCGALFRQKSSTSSMVLTRKLGESIMIGDNIRVTVFEIRGNQVRLGIDAPDEILVLREKVKKVQEAE
jgi:carbon storage regulator